MTTDEENTNENHPVADALRIFIGAIIISFGALIALVSGACVVIGGGEEFGISFLIGAGFFGFGIVIINWGKKIKPD